ncbi:hypothetical protein GMRT_12132 [Giardia muris]|uniref:Uncharacterized protein n=1 Tax=Giardia muris TaxID=5742 RepID=A0A4Z1SML0_GIAMU|nr:hypothetical protein GMRT_12132 [Giardia muris]|eukprot:TNJ26926.1 hypothetical protein GMRT_12132 [Giardia muris]
MPITFCNALIRSIRELRQGHRYRVFPHFQGQYSQYVVCHIAVLSYRLHGTVSIKPRYPTTLGRLEILSLRRKRAEGRKICTCIERGEFYAAIDDLEALLATMKRMESCSTQHETNWLTWSGSAQPLFEAATHIYENRASLHKLLDVLKRLESITSRYTVSSPQLPSEAITIALLTQVINGESIELIDDVPSAAWWLFKSLSDASLLIYLGGACGPELFLIDAELKPRMKMEAWLRRFINTSVIPTEN